MSALPEVTRDVVQDLLPAFVAGEASADTRRVVEDWLARDPSLAREVEALREGERRLVGAAEVPSGDGERAALLRVRALLRARSLAMAGGIFFTLLPFASFYSDGALRFLLLRDAPLMAAVSLAAGALSWFAYGRLLLRLRGGHRQGA